MCLDYDLYGALNAINESQPNPDLDIIPVVWFVEYIDSFLGTAHEQLALDPFLGLDGDRTAPRVAASARLAKSGTEDIHRPSR